ncbi:MAG: FHA domain-containing protein, partial [Deltaproteobacteria bacterium]|nr:FHA domain-containing protein [Deltaproteobacteria bacterium]
MPASIRLIAIGPAAPVLAPSARELSSDSKRISIGNAPDNDLVIGMPGVSRHHAKIEQRRSSYRVIDLESTNGTFVNGERVRGALTFKVGDELRFAGASYRFNPIGKRSSKRLTLRVIAVLVVLIVVAFGAVEFKMAWDRIDQPSPDRSASATPPQAKSGAAIASPSPSGAAAATAMPLRIPPLASALDPAAVARLAKSIPVPTFPPLPPSASSSHPGAPTIAMPPIPSLRDAPFAAVPPATAPTSGVAGPTWLDALNRYRAMSGLAPVENDEATSRGGEAHARYLVENYRNEISHGIGIGANMHREDPSNRWYTAAGARAANSSDVAQWPGPIPPPSPAWAIDGWMSAPFHRLSMLNPRLRTASMGNWCEGSICVVTLNVVAGAAATMPTTSLMQPVRFPAPNSTIAMNSGEIEWPDPVSACHGYVAPIGLPITLQLAFFHTIKLDDYSLTLDSPKAGAPTPIPACGIDGTTYVSPDPEAQRRARDILKVFGAVIVVPRAPLIPGHYTVAIT